MCMTMDYAEQCVISALEALLLASQGSVPTAQMLEQLQGQWPREFILDALHREWCTGNNPRWEYNLGSGWQLRIWRRRQLMSATVLVERTAA